MHATYESFEQRLAGLGFATYADYLNSALWKGIRSRVYGTKGRICIRCKSHRATQIHHAQYDVETLAGRCILHLIPICRSCHEREHGIVSPEQMQAAPPVAAIVIPWDGSRTIRTGRRRAKKKAKSKAQRYQHRTTKKLPVAPGEKRDDDWKTSKDRKQMAFAKHAKDEAKYAKHRERLAAKVKRAGCNPRAFGLEP